jgi:hypothetical protein
MMKKKERKQMKFQADYKIDIELEKTKKLFETKNGTKSSIKSFQNDDMNPEKLAQEILQGGLHNEDSLRDSDDEEMKEEQYEASRQHEIESSIKPLIVSAGSAYNPSIFLIDESDDSGLPDSASDSEHEDKY